MESKLRIHSIGRGYPQAFIGVLFLVFCAGIIQAEEACKPEQGMSFVCGPVNAEDLVWVPGTPWIISSGMSDEGAGHLYLLNTRTRQYETLYPPGSPQHRWDRDMFAVCPGELDTGNFSAHGLSILPQGRGLHRLYVTSHGAREAVEVFEVDSSGEKPVIAWVGCVPMPEYASINSVAALKDGGFITTRISSNAPDASDETIFAGEISGFLYEWHPGGEVTRMAGTDMSGPNGIVVSGDQRSVYVASWGRGEVARFIRDDLGKLALDQTVKVGFRVDNLRWTDDGMILAVGHRLSDSQDCDTPLCFDQWAVAELDPEQMTATALLTRKPIPGFTGATVAIPDNGGLWLGTFHGDRLVYIPDADR